MRNVYVQWAVGALLLGAVGACPLRGEEPSGSRPPSHVEGPKTSELPPIPKPGSSNSASLPLPSGPPTRLERLVQNLKQLRLDPGPMQRIAQSLERAPRMNARQFAELVTLTNELFGNRMTPDQTNALKRLFDDELVESRDLTGVSFASALRVAGVEPPQSPTATVAPTGPAAQSTPNANPFGDGAFAANRLASTGGVPPATLEKLFEQMAKKQSAQLEQLMKSQLEATKLALEASAGKEPGAANAANGANGAAAGAALNKSLFDALLGDLRKEGKGGEGGGETGRGKEEEAPRSRKADEEHSADKGRDRDREGALAKLRERERDRDRDGDRNRGARRNDSSGSDSKSSGSDDKKDDNDKKSSSTPTTSSKKEAPASESKMPKSDFKSLLDEQKKLLEPEAPPPGPVVAKPKDPFGGTSPIDQPIPQGAPGGAGLSGDPGLGGAPMGGPMGMGMGMGGMGMGMGGGGGGMDAGALSGDPFGSIGYGDDGGMGGTGERFSFTRLVEYGGGGGGGLGGTPEIATTVDGLLGEEAIPAALDGKASRGGARDSGQVLRVGIETPSKGKRWIFDWTTEWPKQICRGPDAREVGLCVALEARRMKQSLRRRVSGAEAGGPSDRF
jgi:hypothetical protein